MNWAAHRSSLLGCLMQNQLIFVVHDIYIQLLEIEREASQLLFEFLSVLMSRAHYTSFLKFILVFCGVHSWQDVGMV